MLSSLKNENFPLADLQCAVNDIYLKITAVEPPQANPTATSLCEQHACKHMVSWETMAYLQ